MQKLLKKVVKAVNQPELFNTNKDYIPEPPQLLSFKDFHLTKESYEEIKHKIELKNRWIKYAEKKIESAFGVYGIIFVLVATVFAIYIFSNPLSPQIIQVIFITMFISGVIFYFVVENINFNKCALNKANKIKRFPTTSEFSKFHSYEEAFKIYMQKLAKYEWELSEYSRSIKAKEADYWFSLKGWDFENEFAKILTRHGFKTQVTTGSGDGGIDIFAMKDEIKFAIQCKAHRNTIGPSVIRDLYGSMNHNNIERGILVNLGGFTKGVIEFAKDKSIILFDIDDVIKLHNGENLFWK